MLEECVLPSPFPSSNEISRGRKNEEEEEEEDQTRRLGERRGESEENVVIIIIRRLNISREIPWRENQKETIICAVPFVTPSS